MADREVVDDVNDEFDTLILENNLVYSVRNDDGYEEPIDLLEIFPDQFIADNRESLFEVFSDINNTSMYTSLFDRMDFGYFCEYMEYVSYYHPQDVHAWNDGSFDPNEHEILQYGKRYPTFKQWVRHHIVELTNLFRYLNNIYDSKAFHFGSFELFMETCYDTSSSSIRIPFY